MSRKLGAIQTSPPGTSIKFRTRTANTEAELANGAWSEYLISSGSPINNPPGSWIEVEATLETTNATVTPLLHDVTVTYGNNPGDIVWQSDVPAAQTQGVLGEMSKLIGTIGTAGKYYLQGALTSTTGQTVATSEYPFYVAQGNMLLSINPDKKTYKPGEAVTITGEVKNFATVDATNLTLTIKGQPTGGFQRTLDTETFTIPAGGSRPFTVTTTAGAEETVALTGTITQNNVTLAKISDQYVVAAPQLTATVTAPDVAGNDPFSVSLGLTNSGKTDATVSVVKSFNSLPETVTVPAGETRFLQYPQQITADASYTFIMTGDLNQTVTKMMKYGLGGTVTATPQAIYPAGKITIPATIANTGLIDGHFHVTWRLTQVGSIISQRTSTYYIPKGGNATDTLSFDLPEGSYQLTATGELPALAAATGFSVRREVKADLAMTLGAQTGTILPVATSLTNLGFNDITGVARLSLMDGNGAIAWNSAQDVSLPHSLAPAPQSLQFTINLSALKPGNYTIKTELLDAANRQLAVQTAPFALLGPVFDITQLPPYQTIPAGSATTMTFKVRNSGNQEGSFDLSFKADDLADSSQTAWLKPGEEKEIAFTFTPPSDLEEKDYTATYRLKSSGATVREGVVAYHLAGIRLAVGATLDRQSYSVGETANLTLTIAQQDAGAAPNLFARVNYAGFEEKRDFTLNGSQSLTFTVPLSKITGEKLFYGIYHESGRSIHLNAVYIHKADGVLTVTTDKQVYTPGEVVTVSFTGSATGNLTLTGPGDFVNTFAFGGSATRSFTLPSAMTAGTYTVSYDLTDPSGSTLKGSTPFDVAGIQVKVREALLDKAKYAATDAMRLALTIESNLDLATTVRTWVVDPANSYTEAGSGDVSLTAAAPVIASLPASFATSATGIHKLVYGIYQGDTLLASGAKAFDVGEAVLLALTTDKTDYSTVDQPVTVKADLYGYADAELRLSLDGTPLTSEPLALAGFGGHTIVIPPASLTPGLHKLRAELVTGTLTSAKETSFVYGTALPDLTARITADSPTGTTVPLTATVANQGKTTAGASRVTIYDGNPANGGQAIATLDIPAIAASASTSVTYAWNALGKAGEHLIHVLADSDNAVAEFIEANNLAVTPISLPNLALAVTTSKPAFNAGEEAGITVAIANLTTGITFTDATLKLQVTPPTGTPVDLPDKVVALLSPAAETAVTASWSTGTSAPGIYTLTARLLSGTSEIASGNGSFAIEPTPMLAGSITAVTAELLQGLPLTLAHSLTNTGNVALSGTVRASLVDPDTQAVAAVAEGAAALPVNGTQTGSLTLATDGLAVKPYTLVLSYVGPELTNSLASATVTVHDGIPPSVTVVAPAEGTSYPLSVQFAVIATDNASGVEWVEYQLDNGVWLPLPPLDLTTGRYGTTWEPTSADNGSHALRFRAADRAGNVTAPVTVTFAVEHDSTPPVLTMSTLADGSYTNNGTLNVSGIVSDDNGLKTLRVNGTMVAVTADGSFSYALVLKPEANTVTTEAVDLADNRTSDTRTVTLDQTTPQLVVTAPADNSATARELIDVTGTVDENATVGVSVKDRLQQALMNGTAFAATVPLEPGLNTIGITATDLAGNRSAQKRSVLYDNTRPTLAITEPLQDLTTNQNSLTIRGRVSDTLSAVTVSVASDGQSFAPPVSNGLFEQPLSFTAEKAYGVIVTATDEAGNAVTVQRNIIHDATGPILTIDPVTTPTIQSSQTVTGTKEEGNSVTVSCSTAAVGAVSYPTATTWQTTVSGLRVGDNLITAYSKDAAGNQTTVSSTIERKSQDTKMSVTATPAVLWPPNKKLVPVTIGGGILVDPGDIQSIEVSVTDEYGKYNIGNLAFGSTILLESGRDGTDTDGRIYTITAVAKHGDGSKTTATTTVVVPHDTGK